MTLLCSCVEHFEAKEVYGSYALVGYKNTFDTIQLKAGSIYHRKVYDKNNNLVIEMDGSWNFKDRHRIVFDGLYLNLDDDLVKFPHLAHDSGMQVDTYLETRKDIIGFCVGYFENENWYQKVK